MSQIAVPGIPPPRAADAASRTPTYTAINDDDDNDDDDSTRELLTFTDYQSVPVPSIDRPVGLSICICSRRYRQTIAMYKPTSKTCSNVSKVLYRFEDVLAEQIVNNRDNRTKINPIDTLLTIY
jgi:hypothetical protein